MFPFAQLHCLGLSKGRTVAPASPSKRRRRVSRSRYMSHLRRCGVLEAVVEHLQLAAQPVQLRVQRLDPVHQLDGPRFCGAGCCACATSAIPTASAAAMSACRVVRYRE